MRLFLFIVAVTALVYMEPGSDSLFHGWLLPAVAYLSLAYVFWLGGFVAILVGRLAYHYADFTSAELVSGLFFPLLLIASGLYFVYWAGTTGGMIDAIGSDGGGDGDEGCDGGGL